MKTFVAKPHEVQRDWFVIDAKGKVLLWLFLIYIVVIITFLVFVVPLLKNVLLKKE